MTTYITLLALLVEHSLVHWYQQCVTVHHLPKCMSCHKATVVITGRALCFHDYIYITLIYIYISEALQALFSTAVFPTKVQLFYSLLSSLSP